MVFIEKVLGNKRKYFFLKKIAMKLLRTIFLALVAAVCLLSLGSEAAAAEEGKTGRYVMPYKKHERNSINF